MPVLGICNGFQVLTEAGLLPGALMRNAGLSFVCRAGAADGREQPDRCSPPLRGGREDQHSRSRTTTAITTPTPTTLDRLEGEGRVAFRYAESVNGSARSIAGILNDAGNVLGMMPHPERAIEPAHGSTDGRRLFEGLLETVGLAAALERRARWQPAWPGGSMHR